jgi:hypothetical protein
MQNLKAAHRLVAELVLTDAVEAQFDQTREEELRHLQGHLRICGYIFSFSQHHIFHKSNPKEIAQEAQEIAEELNKLGYQLRIAPNIFQRPSFALKGKNGIVLQKVQISLRIFFTI